MKLLQKGYITHQTHAWRGGLRPNPHQKTQPPPPIGKGLCKKIKIWLSFSPIRTPAAPNLCATTNRIGFQRCPREPKKSKGTLNIQKKQRKTNTQCAKNMQQTASTHINCIFNVVAPSTHQRYPGHT